MRIRPVVLALTLAACGADRYAEPPPPPAPEAPRTPDAAPAAPIAPIARTAPAAPPAWQGAAATLSNAGHWDVRWTSEPAPIPENEPFALTVWVLDRDGELADVDLSVDAAMPEHGHGMNRVPRIVEREDGGFQVDGLLFHMPGRWELYFDVTRGALTERAQVEVVLE